MDGDGCYCAAATAAVTLGSRDWFCFRAEPLLGKCGKVWCVERVQPRFYLPLCRWLAATVECRESLVVWLIFDGIFRVKIAIGRSGFERFLGHAPAACGPSRRVRRWGGRCSPPASDLRPPSLLSDVDLKNGQIKVRRAVVRANSEVIIGTLSPKPVHR